MGSATGTQTETGYRLEAVTVRKLEFENDAFAFGDKVIEKWYPTVEEGGRKGILVLVTSGKDGSLTGGPAFMKARRCLSCPAATAVLLTCPLPKTGVVWTLMTLWHAGR